jgi:hypothetical protein
MVTPPTDVLTTRTAQAGHLYPPQGHGVTPATPMATLPIIAGPKVLPHLLKRKASLRPPKEKEAKDNLVTGSGKARISQQHTPLNKQRRLYMMNPLLKTPHKNGGKEQSLDHHALTQATKASRITI